MVRSAFAVQKRHAVQSLGLAAALGRTVRLAIDVLGRLITTSMALTARAFRWRRTVM
jgi:hypothetical protein